MTVSLCGHVSPARPSDRGTRPVVRFHWRAATDEEQQRKPSEQAARHQSRMAVCGVIRFVREPWLSFSSLQRTAPFPFTPDAAGAWSNAFTERESGSMYSIRLCPRCDRRLCGAPAQWNSVVVLLRSSRQLSLPPLTRPSFFAVPSHTPSTTRTELIHSFSHLAHRQLNLRRSAPFNLRSSAFLCSFSSSHG